MRTAPTRSKKAPTPAALPIGSMPKFGKMRLSKKELQIKTLRSAERQLEEIRRKAMIRMRFLVCRFHQTAQYAIVVLYRLTTSLQEKELCVCVCVCVFYTD